MSTNLSRLLSKSLEMTARKQVTKSKSFKQARAELIKAIAKADGSSTSVTYMVLRGKAQCPERKCLAAFAQVLPNVGMKQIMAATARDGCKYNATGYGRRSKSKAASMVVVVKDGRAHVVRSKCW